MLALTAGNLTLVWINTGPHQLLQPSVRALALITLATAGGLALALAMPPLRALLQFAVPPAPAVLAALACSAAAMLVADLLWRRFVRAAPASVRPAR